MNNIFLFMSFSGSVACLLYCILKTVFKKNISVFWRYRLLKLCMCFYLLPVPLLSGCIRNAILEYIPDFSFEVKPNNVWLHNVSNKIYETPKGYIFPGHSFFGIFFMGLLLLVTFFLLVKDGVSLFRIRKIRNCLSKPSGTVLDMSEKIRQKIHIHRNVSVYSIDEPCIPFSYGLWKPKIIISEIYSVKEKEMILSHELWHIKSCDYAVRILAFAVLALHFFNPIAYFLFYETDKVSELACDAHVVSEYSFEQRKQYGSLLLNILPAFDTGFGNHLKSNNMRIMKERITMIKYPKKSKLAAAAFCAGMLIFCSTMSVIAYDHPQIEWEDDVELAQNIDMYMITFDQEGCFDDPNETYFANRDVFFIDCEGEVYLDINDSSVTEKNVCVHSYKSGFLYSHDTLKNGGCRYNRYSASICTKCKAVKNKKYINTTTYGVCPHK